MAITITRKPAQPAPRPSAQPATSATIPTGTRVTLTGKPPEALVTWNKGSTGTIKRSLRGGAKGGLMYFVTLDVPVIPGKLVVLVDASEVSPS